MQRNSIWPKTFRKYRVTLAKVLYTFLAAFMLGISNVINQEDRTIHDTRFKIEKRQDHTEEEN